MSANVEKLLRDNKYCAEALDYAAESLQPLIQKGAFEPNGLAGAYHNKIIPAVKQALLLTNIQKDPIKAVLEAINSDARHGNLVDWFYKDDAKKYLENNPNVKDDLIYLIHGPLDEYETRLTNFFNTHGKIGKKQGFDLLLINYLVAVAKPNDYAFVRARYYQPAERSLLGIKEKGIERLVTAREFYSRLFNEWRERGLKPRDLMDVHLFNFFLSGDKKPISGYISVVNKPPLSWDDILVKVSGKNFQTFAIEEEENLTINDSDFQIKPTEKRTSVVTRIIRDTPKTLKLKKLYKDKCQVCGLQIKKNDGTFYSEVHHIKPLGGTHNGSDDESNMIVLCPNHHAMFDLGIPKFIVDEIPEEFKTTEIYLEYFNIEINNEIIEGNVQKGHILKKEFIDYYMENIYGKNR